MDTKAEKQIIEASGRLLIEDGSGSFTLKKLSKRPEMKGFDVFALVRNEEQIFEQLLLQLEKELAALLDDLSAKHNSPATEFELLFKQLHRLFKQKPYYLTVIFDSDFRQKYGHSEKIISRIKGVAKNYLAGLIDRGKIQDAFTIDTETKFLVREILGSFQALMNDMQLTDKMIRDLKKYRFSND
jgi:AcrR family transcriptional regulator